MRLNKIIKLFENGNVCVVGLRGKGKDMLMSNIVVRRNKPYISNIDYGLEGSFIPFNYHDIDCGGNTYRNLLEGNITPYRFPYKYGTDVYLSDCGVYYPSQYCNELNKLYPSIPVYQALCRQLSRNNFHFNVQNLNRVWDKIREQSDVYICCNYCRVIGSLVIQRVTIYDKYDSACNRVKPNRIKIGMFDFGNKRLQKQMYIDTFENNHGRISSHFLIYFNKSNYDTYYFEKLLGGDLIEE